MQESRYFLFQSSRVSVLTEVLKLPFLSFSAQ